MPPIGTTPQAGERREDNIQPLPAVTPVPPLFSFDSIEEYERRHRQGTNTEFEFEKREIRRFNAALLKFKAFPMIAMRDGRGSKDILLFVEPREGDSMLPKEDEKCMVDIPGVGLLDAVRKENPCSSWGVRGHYWDRHLVFEFTLPHRSRHLITPFFPGPELITSGMEMPQPRQIQPKDISFHIRLSYSTMEAEIGALNSVTRAVIEDWGEKARAFRYIMDFRTYTSCVNIFRYFPHMASPTSLPQGVASELGQMMRSLDSHQQHAYRTLLSNIPAGVGILPGGPGAGKTHFITTLVAALQSADEILSPGDNAPHPHRNTTLLLCDINKPATDIANKFHRLYRHLSLTRRDPSSGQPIPRVVVRMYCWSYEKKSVRRGRLEADNEELIRRLERGDRNPMAGATGFAGGRGIADYNSAEDGREMVDVHRFSVPFLRAGTSHATRMATLQQETLAPTLDQFARVNYEREQSSEYSLLRNMLRSLDTENFDMTTIVPYAVEREIERVYRNALQKIDVLVTTPVTASKFSSALANIFKPALVIFDEAPHAREASTLIPIAKFNPLAWIFTGDHRQMKPWVGSHGKRPNTNKYAPQLRISMMERAHHVNPGRHALMINHRARGNLHQLPSSLSYGNRMVSAYAEGQNDWLPPSARHLRDSYIMPMKRHNGPPVSRLLVVLGGIGRPTNVQESWYHPAHRQWVKDLVSKLLQDSDFRKADGVGRGTILIMAPYKAASIEYKKVIKELRTGGPRLNTSSVEGRTIDTAQGHEADFVILDLVRDRVTDHLDDPNRLCVALTRSRQAEVILMHEDMLRQLRASGSFSRGPLAYIARHCAQADEFVHRPAPLAS